MLPDQWGFSFWVSVQFGWTQVVLGGLSRQYKGIDAGKENG